MGKREYSDAVIAGLARQLDAYLKEPGSQGAAVWLDDRALGSTDRRAVLLALSDLDQAHMSLVPKPKKRSQKAEAVDSMALQIHGAIETPEREYLFAKSIGRRWRFDLALPSEMVACEVDGGVFIQGRHTRGAGFEEDCRKVGAALELGWIVVKTTPRLVKSGEALRWFLAAVNLRRAKTAAAAKGESA